MSVARHLKIDPEEALRLANHKFAGRFGLVESAARVRGNELRELTPDQLDELWESAKQAMAVAEQEHAAMASRMPG